MAIPALAALFAFGVALALPGERGQGAERLALEVREACPAGALELPPGHPPVGGQVMTPLDRGPLPPGHPPIGGARARRAPPLAPHFEPPQSVDI